MHKITFRINTTRGVLYGLGNGFLNKPRSVFSSPSDNKPSIMIVAFFVIVIVSVLFKDLKLKVTIAVLSVFSGYWGIVAFNPTIS